MSNASHDERSGAFVTYLLTALLGIVGAGIGYFIYKGKGAFARSQTIEALNWAITLFIIGVILNVIVWIIPALRVLAYVSTALWIANIVLSIIAAMKAHKGEEFRYPVALRLIK